MIGIALANHGPFGIYSMTWEDAIVTMVLGIVFGIVLAAVLYVRKD